MMIDPRDPDAFSRMAGRVRNWGRWGPDDQLGTLNFITPESVAAAAAEIRTGRVFPLGIDITANGLWGDGTIRPQPQHYFTLDGGDDPDAIAMVADSEPTETNRAFARTWSTRTHFADDLVVL